MHRDCTLQRAAKALPLAPVKPALHAERCLVRLNTASVSSLTTRGEDALIPRYFWQGDVCQARSPASEAPAAVGRSRFCPPGAGLLQSQRAQHLAENREKLSVKHQLRYSSLKIFLSWQWPSLRSHSINTSLYHFDVDIVTALLCMF